MGVVMLGVTISQCRLGRRGVLVGIAGGGSDVCKDRKPEAGVLTGGL